MFGCLCGLYSRGDLVSPIILHRLRRPLFSLGDMYSRLVWPLFPRAHLTAFPHHPCSIIMTLGLGWIWPIVPRVMRERRAPLPNWSRADPRRTNDMLSGRSDTRHTHDSTNPSGRWEVGMGTSCQLCDAISDRTLHSKVAAPPAGGLCAASPSGLEFFVSSHAAAESVSGFPREATRAERRTVVVVPLFIFLSSSSPPPTSALASHRASPSLTRWISQIWTGCTV